MALQKKSNCGWKLIQNTRLTSPDNITTLKEKQVKRASAKAQKEAYTRATKQSSTSTCDEGDYYMHCWKDFVDKLNQRPNTCSFCKKLIYFASSPSDGGWIQVILVFSISCLWS